MKLPAPVLASLRGSLLGVAIAGCATAPAAPITEEPAPAPAPTAAIVVERPDPVDYDAEAESARLARADDARIDHDARRDRRIAELEADRRARRSRRSAITPNQAPLNPWGPAIHRGLPPNCGRG